ncbi:MAG: hypothetical protein IKL55_05625 [Clostridia bacterium]|nr:hypothetical protein [Clostridia bacterium]
MVSYKLWGIAVALKSYFDLELKEESNEELIKIKNEAMQNKKEYIENKNGEKETFLKQYTESNRLLEEDYKNYSIDQKSYEIIMKIDLNKIINKRKQNVQAIYKKLSNNPKINFLIENYNGTDCLLFVPIILENSLRNSLRKFLTEKEIYLPVHWPLDEKLNNIFDQELSLVCDQRYSKKEIENYLEVIIDYLNTN